MPMNLGVINMYNLDVKELQSLFTKLSSSREECVQKIWEIVWNDIYYWREDMESDKHNLSTILLPEMQEELFYPRNEDEDKEDEDKEYETIDDLKKAIIALKVTMDDVKTVLSNIFSDYCVFEIKVLEFE